MSWEFIRREDSKETFWRLDEKNNTLDYYIGSAEGHEYPDLQVGDEVNPRPVFIFS